MLNAHKAAPKEKMESAPAATPTAISPAPPRSARAAAARWPRP
jgi:hypothetical protein